MVDWNGDGKTDWQDGAMDCMIHEEIVNGGGGGNGNSGNSGGCLLIVMIGLVILYLLSALGSCVG